MSSGRELKSALASVMPGATVIQDSREDGTADTVILIQKKIRVKTHGSSGTGHLAWATIATAIGDIGDLIDTWLEAVRARGPWFTRQAMCGGRLDQARLDRCYVTNRGDWLFLIDEMLHDGSSSLADHIPVKVNLVLQGEVLSEGRKSYYKMDASLLNKEEIKRECEAGTKRKQRKYTGHWHR
ncbi:hypothetical protein R1sor_009778 [Riccia sorocarpa]|uniref:Uncharacterized protein n=1 Tax=Riccia sorocarpa TaxID=122646 RepID=A0ABD3HW28_9MARC